MDIREHLNALPLKKLKDLARRHNAIYRIKIGQRKAGLVEALAKLYEKMTGTHLIPRPLHELSIKREPRKKLVITKKQKPLPPPRQAPEPESESDEEPEPAPAPLPPAPAPAPVIKKKIIKKIIKTPEAEPVVKPVAEPVAEPVVEPAEPIKEFEEQIPPNILKKGEEKELKKNLESIESILNRLVAKGKTIYTASYSGNHIIDSLVNAVLMHKYDIKCPLPAVSKLKTKFKRLYEITKAQTTDSTKYIEKIVNCIKRGVKTITLRVNAAGHANLLIIKPDTKEIIQFEPNGNTFTEDSKATRMECAKIAKRISSMSGIKFKFIPPEESCPRLGFQYFESRVGNKIKRFEGGGYCVMWSNFMTLLILNNPEMHYKEIQEKGIEILKTDPEQFRHAIRGFYLDMNDEVKLLKDKLGDEYTDLQKIADIYRQKGTGKQLSQMEAKLNDILDSMYEERYKKLEDMKAGKLRSMHTHNGINIGYINKKDFKNVKCLCNEKRKKSHCSCNL